MKDTRVLPRFRLITAPLVALALFSATPAGAAAKSTKPAASPPAAAAAATAAIPLENRIGIAATVNDDVVTYTDIRNRMKLYLLGAPGTPPPEVRQKIALQVLGRLIDERLEMQEAKNLGITVEETEVDAAFAHVADNNHLTADGFKEKLSAAGVRLETLQEQIRAQIAWTMVVRRKLRPQVNVSESEIDSELDRRQKNAGKTEYSVSEIFLPVDSPRMDDVVRHGAERIIEQLNHGAPFALAAKQFSKAPGAGLGGDLGWVQEGQLEPRLNDALAKLQVGQISPPIRTDKGYEILFLRDKHSGDSGNEGTPAAAAPPAPSAPEEIVSLKQLVIPTTPNETQASLEAKTRRAADLKSEIASCDAMSAKAKDFSAAGSGDLPKGPLSQQPQDIQDAARGLPIGTLSAPLRRPAGITVLMVCAREAARPGTAPAAAAIPAGKPGDQTREQIATQIGTKRLEQLQERYLKDLRATAYIEKRF